MEPTNPVQKKQLPLVLSVLIVLVLLIVALVYKSGFSFDFNNVITVDNTHTSDSGIADSSLSTKDSDSDGLPDWEEVLRGTDPHNPDTDGDGTSDGDEVKAGRNPLVAGPNDKATNVAGASSNTIQDTSEFDSLSATEKMSRDFFARYVALQQASQQSGQPITAQQQQDLINSVLQGSNVSVQGKKYTSASLQNVDITPSATSIKAYGNTLGDVLIKTSPKALESELVSVYNATNNNDASLLAPINTHIAIYKTIISTYLSTKVPKSAVTLHVALINAIGELLAGDQAMDGFFIDPLPATAGLGLYNKGVTDLGVAVKALRAYFVTNGVTFEKTSPGYAFTNLYQ